MAVFADSAPWSFASEKICALLEHPCSVSEYEQLYGNDFRLAYYVFAAYQTVMPLVIVLSATLYAAQDFQYVRNISVVGLVLLFVPLVVLGYHLDSFLVLTFASIAQGLLTVVGCGWQLYNLSRDPEPDAKGPVSVNAEEQGRSSYVNTGSVNEGLAEYRRSRSGVDFRRVQTQGLAKAREDDYRKIQQQSHDSSGTELHASLLR